MGSIFSAPKPPAPPPPPPPATVRDEIGGTEQVPITNPDGTITYVTRRLPLSAEKQAEKEAYERIMKEALGEIERLSSSDYQENEQTKKVLDAWEEERKILIDDSFDSRQESEEKVLARRGLSESSAGLGVRRQRRLDRQEAQEGLSRERELLKTDIRTQQLGAQQNLYNLALGQQNLDNVRVLQSAAQGQGSLSAVNAINRASVADSFNRQLLSYQASAQKPGLFSSFGSFGSMGGQSSGNSAGSTIGGAIGTALGSAFGPAGSAVGNVLGSQIGGRISG